jgi:hypothetical protein
VKTPGMSITQMKQLADRTGNLFWRSRTQRPYVFGPRLIRTEVWSTDGVLLQTASRHSHPVDKYGLCGTLRINNYLVETNRSMVVRRRCTHTMSRKFLSGGYRRMSVRVMSSTVQYALSIECRTYMPLLPRFSHPLGVMARQKDLGV